MPGSGTQTGKALLAQISSSGRETVQKQPDKLEQELPLAPEVVKWIEGRREWQAGG